MEKNTKNRIHGMIIPEGLKRFIAGLAAAGITLTSTGCGLNDENVTHIQTPGMAGNSISDDSRDEKTTTYESGVTSASTNFTTTTYTTTVTTGRGFMGSDINTDERKKIGSSSNKDDKNGLSNEDNVNLDNKDDDFVQSEVSSKSSTKVNGTSKTSSRENGTSAKSTEKTTASTTKSTTRPTTKSTTILTTEATTVTETEPQTEPQTEPVIDYNNKELIATVGKVFNHISNNLYYDIIANSGYTNMIISIDLGYGNTLMGAECNLVLQALNSGYVNDDVLGWSFSVYSSDDINNFKVFLYNFNNVLERFNGQIDYTKYTLNINIGSFLNDAEQAYKNGTFDDFMVYNFVEGNVSQEVLNNPGAMAILYSYDNGKYLNFDDIDNMLSENVNYVCGVAQGYNYSK